MSQPPVSRASADANAPERTGEDRERPLAGTLDRLREAAAAHDHDLPEPVIPHQDD